MINLFLFHCRLVFLQRLKSGWLSFLLAMVVAGTLIGNPTMMIPAIRYGLMMFVTGTIFGWVVTQKDQIPVPAVKVE